MASDIVRSENGVASEALGASLRRGPLIYRGGHTSDQSWVFEITLPERAPLVAEAFVDNATGIRMVQEERAAGAPVFEQRAATYLDREHSYARTKGAVDVCEHLDLPWASMSEDEMAQARRAFIGLWFEVKRRWSDDSYLRDRFTRVGDYILTRLEFRVGPAWLHVTARTDEPLP